MTWPPCAPAVRRCARRAGSPRHRRRRSRAGSPGCRRGEAHATRGRKQPDPRRVASRALRAVAESTSAPRFALRRHEDHPRRARRRHLIRSTRTVGGATDRLLARKLERHEAGDARQRDPGQLARGRRTKDGDRARGTREVAAGNGTQGDRSDSARRPPAWSAGASPAADGTSAGACTTTGARDPPRARGPVRGSSRRCDQAGGADAIEGPAAELGLEQRRLPLELGAASHDVAHDAPLQRGGSGARPERRQPRGRRPLRRQRRVIGRRSARLGLHEEHAGHGNGDEAGDERLQLLRAGCDDAERPMPERSRGRQVPARRTPARGRATRGPRRRIGRGRRPGNASATLTDHAAPGSSSAASVARSVTGRLLRGSCWTWRRPADLARPPALDEASELPVEFDLAIRAADEIEPAVAPNLAQIRRRGR